jgi:hypothetical protein
MYTHKHAHMVQCVRWTFYACLYPYRGHCPHVLFTRKKCILKLQCSVDKCVHERFARTHKGQGCADTYTCITIIRCTVLIALALGCATLAGSNRTHERRPNETLSGCAYASFYEFSQRFQMLFVPAPPSPPQRHVDCLRPFVCARVHLEMGCKFINIRFSLDFYT